MKTGVQPYSFGYVPQRDSEDTHGPHNDMLPQSGVSRQRPNWPGQYWHPCAQGQTLSLYAVPQNVQRYQGHRLLSAAHIGRPCRPDHHVACPWLSGASYCGGLWIRRADRRGVGGTCRLPRPSRPGTSGRATAGPRPRAGRRDTRQAPRGRGLDGAGDGWSPPGCGWLARSASSATCR